MAPVSAPDWDQLLQQSETLASRVSIGYPDELMATSTTHHDEMHDIDCQLKLEIYQFSIVVSTVTV